MSTSGRSAILLRAVNLGKHNKVPMAELRVLCERIGLGEVSTYIASGNIVCATPPDLEAALRTLESAIEQEFGVTTPAIARTHEQLADAIARSPYADADPKLMHVVYLAGEPDPAGAAALADRDFGKDECQVIGTQVYARYTDNTHSSKLTATTMEKLLGVPGTARNWRTAMKLAELTADRLTA